MRYRITDSDLERCFKFAVEYHLDKTKLASNRITGQYRGLGGIIDSFFAGKLIEIGVSKMLDEISGKECVFDFDLHSINQKNISDPDILKIRQDGIERTPSLFVEIKNISPGDRWIGLTAEQFTTIMKNASVAGDPQKVMIIYASILSENETADDDALGVYLRSKTGLDIFNPFCMTNDIYIETQYIITAEDLKTRGTEFNHGSYLYETEIFAEAGQRVAKQIRTGSHPDIYKKIQKPKGILPIVMRDNYPRAKEYGDFFYEGDIEVYKKRNRSSERMYVFAKSDTVVKNRVLGFFELQTGKLYDTFFTTVGMNPSLKRNNVWIAHRNLPNIVSRNPDDMLKEIAEKI